MMLGIKLGSAVCKAISGSWVLDGSTLWVCKGYRRKGEQGREEEGEEGKGG